MEGGSPPSTVALCDCAPNQIRVMVEGEGARILGAKHPKFDAEGAFLENSRKLFV